MHTSKNKQLILITGAAGYVGKAVVFFLKKTKNFKLVLIDKKDKPKLRFFNSLDYIKSDLNFNLEKKLYKIKPNIIIHLAALTSVIDSNKFKKKYTTNNYIVTKKISDYCDKFNKKLIFASSAAIYKSSKKAIKEDSPKQPSNFYGKTKLDSEEYIIKKLKKNSNYVILRFFNIAGGEKKNGITFSSHNFPVLKIITLALKNNKKFKIYGINPKNEKTAIRDYIHVYDIGKIIKKSINYLLLNNEKNLILNCCTGIKTNILDLVNIFNKVSKKKLIYKIVMKRKYEDFIFFGNNYMLKKTFKFKKFFSLKKIVKDSYESTE
jgi:UDP-glucose 4-epimerase